MKKSSLFLFIILLPTFLCAKRMVYFKNDTNFPADNFLFIFVWHSPDATQEERDKAHHQLGFMHYFKGFPNHIDLDSLVDTHTNKPVQPGYIVDLFIKTTIPSGLETRTYPPHRKFYKGELRRIKPLTYSVKASDLYFEIQFEPVIP